MILKILEKKPFGFEKYICSFCDSHGSIFTNNLNSYILCRPIQSSIPPCAFGQVHPYFGVHKPHVACWKSACQVFQKYSPVCRGPCYSTWETAAFEPDVIEHLVNFQKDVKLTFFLTFPFVYCKSHSNSSNVNE